MTVPCEKFPQKVESHCGNIRKTVSKEHTACLSASQIPLAEPDWKILGREGGWEMTHVREGWAEDTAGFWVEGCLGRGKWEEVEMDLWVRVVDTVKFGISEDEVAVWSNDSGESKGKLEVDFGGIPS